MAVAARWAGWRVEAAASFNLVALDPWCGSNPPMPWGLPVVEIGVLAVIWCSAYFGWRWSRRRLRLDAPDAPEMGQRERSVRRSLRALLAFDFFILWPLGVPSFVGMTIWAFYTPEMWTFAAGMTAWVAAFTVAIPMLVRMARTMEHLRVAGLPDAVPPSVLIEGVDALLSRHGPPWARRARYAVLAVLIVAGLFDWKMTFSIMCYGGIFAAVRWGWRMLTQRTRA